MMNVDLSHRFGFLVNEVSRLYSQQFDRLAREALGLSQAQCRLLWALATHAGKEALSQAELAERLGITPMSVASLCDRMAAAGWIERRAQAQDRRVHRVHMNPRARTALEQALAIGDELTAKTLRGLDVQERAQLTALLSKARECLQAESDL